MDYQLQISKKSRKFFADLDLKMAERIGAAIDGLVVDVLVVFVIRIGHRKDIYR